MKIVSLILAMVGVLSCFFEKTGNNAKWELVAGKGLNDYIKDKNDPRYPSYPDKVSPFFISDSIGFLYGSTETTKKWSVNPNILLTKAIIYKTIDGGYNWKKYDFGEGTSYCSIKNTFENKIYADVSGKRDTYKFYKYFSENLGEEWVQQKSATLPDGLRYIMKEKKALKEFILGIDNFDEVFYWVSEDDAKSWKKFKLPLKAHSIIQKSIYFDGDKCWFISSKRTGVRDSRGYNTFNYYLGYLNYEKNEGDIENLPKGFTGQVVAKADNGNFWIAGYAGEDIVVYERTGKEQYKIVKEIKNEGVRLSAEYLNINEDEILFVYQAVKAFFPERVVISSRDKGKTWEEEKLVISSYFKNPFFYHDKKKHKTLVWADAGGGRIQMRK